MPNGVGALRIFMILEGTFPTTGTGGVEKQVAILAENFRRQGCTVNVIIPMVPFGVQERYGFHNGIYIYRVPYPRLRFLGGLLMLLRLAFFLWMQRKRYDVIHAHVANKMAAVACVVGRLTGKPVVVKLTGAVELNDGILKDSRLSLRIALLRWAIRKADAYQAISKRIASLLEAKGFEREKIKWIPNAFDPGRFRPHGAVVEPPELEDLTVCVYAGRFVAVKGLEPFLAAWREVFGPDSPVKLLMLGEGPLGIELKRKVEEWGLQGQIKFMGEQEHPEDFIKIADFCVLPSLAEGLSNTLLEYMALGKPVLGSRISGTEDLIEDSVSGWLFSAGDHQGLVKALRAAHGASREQRKEMGLAAKKALDEHARLDGILEKLSALYGAVLTAAAQRG